LELRPEMTQADRQAGVEGQHRKARVDAWIACSGRDPLTPFSRPSGLPRVAATFLDESELVVLATS
jgi:hypothetical protein